MKGKVTKNLAGKFSDDIGNSYENVTDYNIEEIIDLMDEEEIPPDFAETLRKLLKQSDIKAVYDNHETENHIEVFYIYPNIYTKVLSFTELVFQLRPGVIEDNQNGALRLDYNKILMK